jgi:hypothetical protein
MEKAALGLRTAFIVACHDRYRTNNNFFVSTKLPA